MFYTNRKKGYISEKTNLRLETAKMFPSNSHDTIYIKLGNLYIYAGHVMGRLLVAMGRLLDKREWDKEGGKRDTAR